MEKSANTTQQAGQFLSFELDRESFAIDVAQIREIVDQANVTRIPRMPDFLLGVTNLRGSVVPVVDMRVKFDMGRVEDTVDSCIIVLEIDVDDEKSVVGAYVDAVQEVFEMSVSDIEPPPKMGTRLDTAFIHGMGRRGEEFVILLDVNKVFSADEIQVVQSAVTVEAGGSEDASTVERQER